MPAETVAAWSKWPRLSETLEGPREPGRCTSCGEPIPPGTHRWREGDDSDRIVGPIIVLCDGCADGIVEPHPRLYAEVPSFAPHAGTEQICIACVHRRGLCCVLARMNGGRGIKLTIPTPMQAHVLRRPRALSGWQTIYRGPAFKCTGREVAGA